MLLDGPRCRVRGMAAARWHQLDAEARRILTEPARRVQLRGRALAPLWRRRFQHFGEGAYLDVPYWLYGADKIAIDDHAMILRGAWLSVEQTAWNQPGPVLSIGKGVGIRQYVTISASTSITIEDYVGIGGWTTILDSTHTHGPAESFERPGPHESVLNQPSELAPVRIGRGTWIGDRVTVVPGANIGAHCTIGSNSVVRGEVPDYAVVMGIPARVVGTNRR